MKLARIRIGSQVHLAVHFDDQHLLLAQHLNPDLNDNPLDLLSDDQATQAFKAALAALQAEQGSGLVESLTAQGSLVRTDSVSFEPPICRPPQFYALALNYRDHAAEGDFTPPPEPTVFIKASHSLIGHGEMVAKPADCERLDYEVELGVVIGRRARNLTKENWRDVVAGYTIINDVTARDMQLRQIEGRYPWDMSKSMDTFGPTGPWLITPDEVPDPQVLAIELRVNGGVRQKSNTRYMIYSVEQTLQYLTKYLTLFPGDLIATGTPGGIGPVKVGDVMEAEVEGLGVLTNTVGVVSA